MVCTFTAYPDYTNTRMRTSVIAPDASCGVVAPPCDDPQPVEAYDFQPVPNSLKQEGNAQSGTAQVTVYGENWTGVQQTITMSSAFAQ